MNLEKRRLRSIETCQIVLRFCFFFFSHEIITLLIFSIDERRYPIRQFSSGESLNSYARTKRKNLQFEFENISCHFFSPPFISNVLQRAFPPLPAGQRQRIALRMTFHSLRASSSFVLIHVGRVHYACMYAARRHESATGKRIQMRRRRRRQVV